MGDGFESLSDDLKAALRGGILEPWPDQFFGDWALRVFEHQLETNAIYASYCRRRGVIPSTLADWKRFRPFPRPPSRWYR